MRVCRFAIDGLSLAGFYDEERIVPICEAAELYAEIADAGLILPATSDLLDLLPPDGETLDSLRQLARWIAADANLDEIAIPIGEARLLTPIPRPPKILLLAGNYAEHVREQGGTAAERESTFPYVSSSSPRPH